MNQQDPVSNGSNNATNNIIPEPVVGQNLFPIQSPLVRATNTMPPPITGSIVTDSALHAAQFQPSPSNNSTSSTSFTSTTHDGNNQNAPTAQTIAETSSSGVTFVSTPTNNSSGGPDPVTPQTNSGVNQSPNVIGNQTDTSGNS
jgi:hypothetical protein